MIPARLAARVAFFASAANLAASLAMLTWLRPGLPVPGSDPLERARWVRENPGLWRSGWLLWHLAAIALAAFYVGLAGRVGREAPIRAGLALLCAGAGLAADLAAEAVLLDAPFSSGAIPGERHAALLTGYLGNGLYTVAGALLTSALARSLPRGLLALSLPVWLAGATLSAATLARSAAWQVWATAALMPLFVLWSALVGRWLSRLES